MSMGRRVTLIKSVLSSTPIYFLPCFKCPKGVLRRIEKIQCGFLWNDSVEKRKYHLVRWESVLKHLDQGGLDIRSIAKVNKPLLGKWLWRVGKHSSGSWRKIIVCKYKLGNNGWCIPNQDYFDQWIHYRVHDGRQVRFWHNEW